MNQEIKVPPMGESISEGVIGQIFAPSGTIVKADDEVLELETDKVNQAIYSPIAGRVRLTVKVGDTVKIGQTIGLIEGGVVEIKETKPEEPPAPSPQKSVPVQPIPPPKVESIELGEAVRYGKEAFLADLKIASKTEERKPSQDIKMAVPSARPSWGKETRRPMSRIRKVIAERLVRAQQSMAMLTTFNEVDLTQVIQLREKYKEEFVKKYGCKLGFMSFFVKATVAALEAYPDLNSYIDGDEIVHRETYDIGVAVGTDRGVIVPVIRNCDQLSYAEIEKALENFAKKAREGKLSADDLQGGGFTITNGGIYGSLLSTPILLPPQCGILGMHKIEKRPVVINDQITIRSMMYLALSYDHRLIDGKEAVSFLVHLKNTLEDSSRLLLHI